MGMVKMTLGSAGLAQAAWLLVMASVACDHGQGATVVVNKQSEPWYIEEQHQDTDIPALYSLKLDARPVHAVTVSFLNSDGKLTVRNSSIFFSPENWNVSQYLGLVGNNDVSISPTIYVGALGISVDSQDPNFDGVSLNIPFPIRDNDLAECLVTRSTAIPYPDDIPEGASQNYDIRLLARPTFPVDVVVTAHNETIEVAPSGLVFTSSTWNISQTITVFAIDDDEKLRSPNMAFFSVFQTSSDFNFDGHRQRFNVTIEDNDKDASLLQTFFTWKVKSATATAVVVEFTIYAATVRDPTSTYVVGSGKALNGEIDFGDGSSRNDSVSLIVGLTADSVAWITTVEHTYDREPEGMQPMSVSTEQCCRALGRGTQSRLETVLDLDYVSASPIVGYSTEIYVALSPATQFYLPVYSQGNPIAYRLATSDEYGSTTIGTPHGLTVDAVLGLVSWDTEGVQPGRWFAMFVVEDLVTLTEVMIETVIVVVDGMPYATVENDPRQMVYLQQGVAAGSAASPASLFAPLVSSVNASGPLPAGATLSTSGVLDWTPSSDQAGGHIVCAQYDRTGVVSSPGCAFYEVVDDISLVDQPTVQSNPRATSYMSGRDASIRAVAFGSISTSGGLVQKMTVQLGGVQDGGQESIYFPASQLERLSVTATMPGTNTIIVEGAGSTAAYTDLLTKLEYAHSSVRPTLGNRTIMISVETATGISSAATQILTVAVEDVAPAFSLDSNTTGTGFRAMFFRNGPAVSITGEVSVVDDDSDIRSATLQLSPVPDAPEEVIMSTYITPPLLSTPVVVNANNVGLSFGVSPATLSVSHSLNVTHAGTVGDVDVVVDIKHSALGELTVTLSHAGIDVVLTTSPGGITCSVDDMLNTMFTEDALARLEPTQSSPGSCVALTKGAYKPFHSLHRLRAAPVAGEWTLRIDDSNGLVNAGQLDNWGLVVSTDTGDLREQAAQPFVPAVGVSTPGIKASRKLSVEAPGKVVDVAVHVQMDASEASNLHLNIVHPDGTSVALIDRDPTCSEPFPGELVFTDQAPTHSPDCGSLPAIIGTGMMAPASPLSALNGKRINGVWKVEMELPGCQSHIAALQRMMTACPKYANEDEDGSGSGSGSGSDTSASTTCDLSEECAAIVDTLTIEQIMCMANGNSNGDISTAISTAGVELFKMLQEDRALCGTGFQCNPTADHALLGTLQNACPPDGTDDDGALTYGVGCGATSRCAQHINTVATRDATCFADISDFNISRIAVVGTACARDASAVLHGVAFKFRTEPNCNAAYDNATGTLVFTGVDTAEMYQSVLNTIVYRNLNLEPNGTSREVEFTVTDTYGESTSNVADVSIHNLNTFYLPSVSEDVYSPEFSREFAFGLPIVNASTFTDVYDLIMSATPVEDRHGNRLYTDSPQSSTKWTTAGTPKGLGVAITAANNDNGQWQFSIDAGLNWTDINASTLSPTAAVILASEPMRANVLRFIPDRDFHEVTSVTFVVWEMNGLYPTGTEGADATIRAGTIAEANATAYLQVDPINDSPIVVNYLGVSVSEQYSVRTEEDTNFADNEGVLVKRIIAHSHGIVDGIVDGNYTDIDRATPSGADAIHGIAVTEVEDNGNSGDWEWSIDGGETWYTFRGGHYRGTTTTIDRPLEDYATVLSADSLTKIRFSPNLNYNTEFDLNGDAYSGAIPHLKYKGWDNTTTDGVYLANGQYPIDTVNVDGTFTNPFSNDVAMMRYSVTSLNDFPSIAVGTLGSGRDHEVSYLEDHVKVNLVNTAALSISDPDDAQASRLSVVLTPAVDGYNETVEYTLPTSLSASLDLNEADLTLTLTLTPASDRRAPIGDYLAVLQSLTYRNSLQEPTPGQRIVSFAVEDTDQSDPLSAIATTTVTLVAFNDVPDLNITRLTTEPVLTDTYFASFVESGSPTYIVDRPNVVIRDHDNSTMSALTVVLTNPLDGPNETLACTIPNTATGVTYTYADGTLAIVGEASNADYVQIVQSLTYANQRYDYDHGNPTPGTRTIELALNDGDKDSLVATVQMTFAEVNDEPYVDLNGPVSANDFAVEFTEEQGSVALVSPNMVVYDIDNATLAWIDVVITDTPDGADESLTYSPYSVIEVQLGGAEVSIVIDPQTVYHPANRTLRIAGLDSVAEYMAILRSVRYNNVADEPNDVTREVTFTASDGLLTSAVRSTLVSVTMVNDAPAVNVTAVLTAPRILEDISRANNSGVPVEVMLNSFELFPIIDDDTNASFGIAIVDPISPHGEWQYSVNDGNTWQPILLGAPGTNVFLLDMEDYIRFLPNQDFNGIASLTFRAWDRTFGTSGSLADYVGHSSISTYSEVAILASFDVEPVNDAPVLIPQVSIAANDIDEDFSEGVTTVAEILSAANITDVDTFPHGDFGIAVTSVDERYGNWQFSVNSGVTFLPFGAVSVQDAVVLQGDATVRFVPRLDYHGTAEFQFVAWDQTDLHNHSQGSRVDATTSVTAAYSALHQTVIITVNPVNDRPESTGQGGQLLAINEDNFDNAGTLVSVMLEDYEDRDEMHLPLATADDTGCSMNCQGSVCKGIAVTAVDRRNGDWFWRCNASLPWARFIGGRLENQQIFPEDPSEAEATLLAGCCSVKFVPTALFNTFNDTDGMARPDSDTPSITYKLWDRFSTDYQFTTTFVDGNNITRDSSRTHTYAESVWPGIIAVNTVTEGWMLGSDSFSVNETRSTITVDSKNNLPVLVLGNLGSQHEIVFEENHAPVSLVTSAFSLTDVDNATVDQVTVTLEGITDPGYESIDFATTDTPIENNTVSDTGVESCTDVRGIWQDSQGNDCNWYADNTARCSLDEQRRQRRNACTDMIITAASVNEDDSGSGSGDSVSGDDSGDGSSEDQRVHQQSDEGSGVDESGSGSGDGDSGYGSGDDTEPTEFPWQDSHGNTCDWYANDTQRCSIYGPLYKYRGFAASEACCACGGSGGSGGSATPTQPVERTSLIIQIVYDGNLTAMNDSWDRGEFRDGVKRDVALAFQRTSDDSLGNNAVDFSNYENSPTSVLLISGSIIANVSLDSRISRERAEEVAASMERWAAMSAGGEEYPQQSARVLEGTFAGADGLDATDACCVCDGGHRYIANRTTVYTVPGSWQLEVHSELLPTSEVGVYTQRNVISGGREYPWHTTSDAALVSYAELLNLTTYSNSHEEPRNNSRSVHVTVEDGSGDIVTQNVTVTVHLLLENRPQVETNRLVVHWQEGDPAVKAVPAATIYDADHNDLFQLKSLRIYSRFAPCTEFPCASKFAEGDVLDADVSQFPSLSKSYDNATGTLQITGRAPVSAYQSVLRSVTYVSEAVEPLIPSNYTNAYTWFRTFAIEATDNHNLTSEVKTFIVAVYPINDQMPNVSTLPSYELREDEQTSVALQNITLSDSDSADLPQQSVTLQLNSTNGNSEWLIATASDTVSVNWNASQRTLVLTGPATVVAFNAVLAGVAYVNTAEEPGALPSGSARTVTVTLDDNAVSEVVPPVPLGINATSNTHQFQITIITVDDTSFITVPASSAIEYVEGSPPVTLFGANATSTITDYDSPILEELAVNIAQPIADGASEALSIAQVVPSWATVTGNGTGALEISGNGSIEEYTALLNAITFAHTDANPGNPTAGERIISVRSYDGNSWSAAASVTTVVIPVNDAPILTNVAHTVHFVEETNATLIINSAFNLSDVDSVSAQRWGGSRIANPAPADYPNEGLTAPGIDGLSGVRLASPISRCTYTCEQSLDTSTSSTSCSTDCALVADLHTAGGSCNDTCSMGYNGTNACLPMCGFVEAAEQTSWILFEAADDGDLTIFQLEAALRLVRYHNTNDEPVWTGRRVEFFAADRFNHSIASGSSMRVLLNQTNDLPRVVLDPTSRTNTQFGASYSVKFAEGGTPVALYNASAPSFGVVEDDDHFNIGFSSLEVTLETSSAFRGEYEGIFSIKGATATRDYDNVNLSRYDRFYHKHMGELPGERHTLEHTLNITSFNTSDIAPLSELDELIKDLRYVNLDHNPVPGSVRTIRIVVRDAVGLASAPQYARITVIARNNAPMVDTTDPIEITVDEDTDISLDVLARFEDDSDDFELNAGLISTGVNGTLRITQMPIPYGTVQVSAVSNDTVVFTPQLNDYGLRSFQVQACDYAGLCSADVTINVTVVPIEDAPQANPGIAALCPADITCDFIDGELTVYLMEDAELLSFDLHPFFYDVEDYHREPFWDDQDAMLSIEQSPDNAFASRALSCCEGQQLTFTPVRDFIGRNPLLLNVTDSRGTSSEIAIVFVVANVNDIPTFVTSGLTHTVQEDAIDASLTVELTDVEDGVARLNTSAVIVDGPSHGIADIFCSSVPNALVPNSIKRSCQVLYTPTANYNGVDTITLMAVDEAGAAVTANMTITVASVLDNPFQTVLAVHVEEDVPYSFSLIDLFSYPDADLGDAKLLAGQIRASPSDTVQHARPGGYDRDTASYTYAPFLHFTGNDTFAVDICAPQACDSNPDFRQTFTVTVVVAPVNDLPVATPITLSMYEDNGTAVSNVWINVNDVDAELPKDSITFFRKGHPQGPSIGDVSYDTTTGFMTYSPDLDNNGIDSFFYTVCDQGNTTCALGQVTIDVLPVNDAPVVNASFTFAEVREDGYNLVLGYGAVFTDPDIISTSSIMPMVSGDTPELLMEVITPASHATLTPYSRRGHIGYHPDHDFVGEDNFTIRVCDTCSDVRAPIGRELPIECLRQRELYPNNASEDDTNADPGCFETTIFVHVLNVNDPPIAPDLSMTLLEGVQGELEPYSFVGDVDDAQRTSILSEGLDPLDFGFDSVLGTLANIDNSSLRIESFPAVESGSAEIVERGTVVRFTPLSGFRGYSSLTYIVCDIAQNDMPELCSRGTIHVRVTTAAPVIISAVAVGACFDSTSSDPSINFMDDDCVGKLDTDAKFSNYDKIIVTFSAATNMPPHNTFLTWIDQADLDQIIVFNSSSILRTTRRAMWRAQNELMIVFSDITFPEPHFDASVLSVSTDATRSCGQFISDSEVYIVTNSTGSEYCITDTAGLSDHSNSSMVGLGGNWGQRLSEVTMSAVTNNIDAGADYFGAGTNLTVDVYPPLSAAQLYMHCEKGASVAFNLSEFGTGVEAGMDCTTYDSATGQEIPRLTSGEYDCILNFDTMTPAEQFVCLNPSVPPTSAPTPDPNNFRARRQVTGVTTLSTGTTVAYQESSRASRFEIGVTAAGPAFVDPSQPEAMFRSTVRAWRHDNNTGASFVDVARTVITETGVGTINSYRYYMLDKINSQMIDFYPPATRYFVLGDLATTPQITQVGATHDDTGMLVQLQIKFSRDTNVPSDQADFAVAKSGIDSLLEFRPSLAEYTGRWNGRAELVIDIKIEGTVLNSDPRYASKRVPDIIFKDNTELIGATTTNTGDACRGQEICGTSVPGNWGICDESERSCRVFGTFSATNITLGTTIVLEANTESNNESGSFDLWWILLLVVIVLIVLWVMHRYIKANTAKRKADRQLKDWRAKMSKMPDGDIVDSKPTSAPDTGEVWDRPDPAFAMRPPDPFLAMPPALRSSTSGTQAFGGAPARSGTAPNMPRSVTAPDMSALHTHTSKSLKKRSQVLPAEPNSQFRPRAAPNIRPPRPSFQQPMSGFGSGSSLPGQGGPAFADRTSFPVDGPRRSVPTSPTPGLPPLRRQLSDQKTVQPVRLPTMDGAGQRPPMTKRMSATSFQRGGAVMSLKRTTSSDPFARPQGGTTDGSSSVSPMRRPSMPRRPSFKTLGNAAVAIPKPGPPGGLPPQTSSLVKSRASTQMDAQPLPGRPSVGMVGRQPSLPLPSGIAAPNLPRMSRPGPPSGVPLNMVRPGSLGGRPMPRPPGINPADPMARPGGRRKPQVKKNQVAPQ